MDETLNMDNEVLDCQEPETNRVGILRRLRDRDLLRKRKAEAEEKETKQVESKRRRARGEQRSGTGRRGRPRKIENLFEILPIQEKEKGEEQVQQAPQPPAEESLPEAVEAGPAHTFYSRSIAPAYIPTSPAPPLNVTSVETPVIASFFTNLFQTAPTLTLNPTLAQAPTQTPTPAPNSVSEPTDPAPSTQSPPLPPSSGQSQSETTVEAPVSAGPMLALAPAPAPASPALVYTTESATIEAEGQVTIEDLGPDEMEDVCLTQKEEAVNRLETDSVEGPSPPVVAQSTMFSSPLLTSLSTTQGYFTDK
ncbi:mucin-7 isoform X2 [Gadus chalcogrammus]|uniref:mucin-7 isoform X2 n=1 Tax=Gadus chalcogrammus TaxID=1042646 RepID=UPI0024C3DD28|nr:mucin-7 isoform X2 [Gadus chalcogrammus]